MAGAIVDKTVSITWFGTAVKGWYKATIDEYDTDAEPQIKAISSFGISGEIYTFETDESITGWSGISVSTQAYIKILPSGSTCTAEFTSAAPTWDDTKQGWYNGTDRYIWAVYKDSTGLLYQNKCELPRTKNARYLDINYIEQIDTIKSLTDIEEIGFVSGRTTTSSIIAIEYGGTSDTLGDVYDDLAPHFKSVGDVIFVTGYYIISGDLYAIYHAAKTSGSAISIEDVKLSDGTRTVRSISTSTATAVSWYTLRV